MKYNAAISVIVEQGKGCKEGLEIFVIRIAFLRDASSPKFTGPRSIHEALVEGRTS